MPLHQRILMNNQWSEEFEYYEVEEVGPSTGPTLDPEDDDSSYLFIAAEEDFKNAIPNILCALYMGESKNVRESCIFLIGCYGDPKLLGHVLKSLERERGFEDKVDEYIYINCLLDLGEIAVKPMLELWKFESDSYVRDVAREFLSRWLMKPL
jgi:hypothetical protein